MAEDLSPWALSAKLTEDDYDILRDMGRHDGRRLVGRYGAEEYRFEELIKAGLVKRMSPLCTLAPGFELTTRGQLWVLDHA